MATIFDRISRALLKRYPEMLGWLLGTSAFRLVRWLDTHLGSPDAAERTADALAYLANESDGGRPWAVLVEFQTEADAEMFGRALEYLGGVWRREKPEELPGDRFAVAAIIVNLTGKGNTFPALVWPEAGFSSGVPGRDINLAALDAAELVEKVVRGEAPAVLLAWIPLMQRGDEAGIIARWKEVAGGVTDTRLRADLNYARTFAMAAKRGPAWQETGMDWTRTESSLFNEMASKALAQATEQGMERGMAKGLEVGLEKGMEKGLEKGIEKGQAQLLVGVLEDLFGALPAELTAAIGSQRDPATFRRWTAQAAKADSLAAFRQAIGQ